MLKEWLKLTHLDHVSTAVKRELVLYFDSPDRLFQASKSELRQTEMLGAKGIQSISNPSPGILSTVSQNLALLKSEQVEYIGFSEAGFPQLLNHISNPPLGLFTKGNLKLLDKPQISIVGSRSPSPSGLRTAKEFARQLGEVGFIITSGMAVGVDKSAHLGCLEANTPTIAVMGTGIDVVYPYSNRRLYDNIIQGGLIVAEFPPGTPARRQHFPQRNRLISGLSLGTVVIEAGIRSGSLITARLAAEQGRDVFAVPGSIYLPTSRGCHKLIKDGAKLVESVEDILEEYPDYSINSASPADMQDPAMPFIGDEKLIYSLIDYAPIAIDKIINECGLTPTHVSSILLTLELAGAITETGSGYQRV